MQSVRGIFVLSIVLLVPFLYYATSVPVACAVPHDMFQIGQDCTGKETDRKGKTCCWISGDPGPDKGKKVCQTCYTKTGADGSYFQACSPVKPAAFKSTLPGLETQDRLPGGGVFELPETNATFSDSNSSSNTSSNTLAQLQSQAEDDSAENNRDEADESEESGDTNEEEDE